MGIQASNAGVTTSSSTIDRDSYELVDRPRASPKAGEHTQLPRTRSLCELGVLDLIAEVARGSCDLSSRKSLRERRGKDGRPWRLLAEEKAIVLDCVRNVCFIYRSDRYGP